MNGVIADTAFYNEQASLRTFYFVGTHRFMAIRTPKYLMP